MTHRNFRIADLISSGQSLLDEEIAHAARSINFDVNVLTLESFLARQFRGDATVLLPLSDMDAARKLPFEELRRFDCTVLVAEQALLKRITEMFYDGRVVAWPCDGETLATALRPDELAALPRWVVGRSAAFRAVLTEALRFARFDVPVLIEGETGTGKEVVARAVHYHSDRAERPFLPINCGAMPDHLFESEMFGHTAGAFTDARTASPGLVGLAEAGTLFLDEVDALSPHAQVSLLRFLQDGSYRNVGCGIVKTADVRVVAASNRPLRELASRGDFREDLLFRLDMAAIRLPPLRERRDDILPLARHFLRAACERFGTRPKTLSPEMMAWLLDQPWPGNVRHLQNVVERAFILADGDVILPPGGRVATPQARPCQAGADEGFASAKARLVAAFEKDYLIRLMAMKNGNVTHAARAAGKERKAFDRLLRKHGIRRADFAHDGSGDAAE